MNIIFLVLVLMPRFLKADFLREVIIRIANFFVSFPNLCNSNQGPAQELWNWKTWIIKQANIQVYKKFHLEQFSSLFKTLGV